MKKLLIPLAIVLVAGCSDKVPNAPAADSAQPAADVASQPDGTVVPVAAEETNPSKLALYSKLPDQTVRFDFDFGVKGDQVVDKENGTKRRGVSIEYRNIEGDALWAQLDSAFAKAGYAPRGEMKIQDNGGQSRVFNKAGSPEISVSTAPRTDEQKAKGTGIIWLGWNVDGAQATAKAPAENPAVPTPAG